jgi:hypothetical protein
VPVTAASYDRNPTHEYLQDKQNGTKLPQQHIWIHAQNARFTIYHHARKYEAKELRMRTHETTSKSAELRPGGGQGCPVEG